MSEEATSVGEIFKHWGLFGQRGQPSKRRIQPSERRVQPFQKPLTSPWDIKVPVTDLNKLLNGFIPRQMEDKWFMYADGPDAEGCAMLHMFRSWTGAKMVELEIRLAVEEDGDVIDATITRMVWESAQIENEERAKYFAKEASNWVLGVKLFDPPREEAP
jgi:hypothetical protein